MGRRSLSLTSFSLILMLLGVDRLPANPIVIDIPTLYGWGVFDPVLLYLFLLFPVAGIEWFILRAIFKPARGDDLLALVVGVHLVSFPVVLVLGFGLEDRVPALPILLELCVIAVEGAIYLMLFRRPVWRARLKQNPSARRCFGGAALANLATWAVGVAMVAVAAQQQVTPGVSRWRADLRSIQTAIESYLIDWSAYPPTLFAVTSPAAYMTMVPLDPFSEDAPFQYHSQGRPGSPESYYIMWGLGPDEDLDLELMTLDSLAGNRASLETRLAGWRYDATNGTVSDGDVFRLGPWREP